MTVSDNLRVRSEPRVADDSIKYEPLLPLGTELTVLDGPVNGSGYTWYRIAPVSFTGLEGPGQGWVAKAARTASPGSPSPTRRSRGVELAKAERRPRPGRPGGGERPAAASINAFAGSTSCGPCSPTGRSRQTRTPSSPRRASLSPSRWPGPGPRVKTAAQMDAVLHIRLGRAGPWASTPSSRP